MKKKSYFDELIMESKRKNEDYVERILDNLIEEINSETNNKKIKKLETKLSKNFEILVKITKFYSIPIWNIGKIIKMVDFQDIDNYYELLYQFISNLTKENKNSHFLLKWIQCLNLDLSFEQCINLLSLFSNCQLLSKLVQLYYNNKKLGFHDSKYELKKKEEEIQQLKDYMNKHNLIYLPEVKTKPFDFENDIH